MAGFVDRYPFPIAHPAQLVTTARTPAERLERAGYTIEMTAVTLGVLALGWCRSRQAGPTAVAAWEQAVTRKGIALGGWTTLLASVRPVMATTQPDPIARAVGQAIEAVLPRLRGYTPTRNQYAHGGRPRVRAEEAAAASDLEHRALTVLDSIQTITGLRIGVVRGCRSHRPGRYTVDLDVFDGYAETPAADRLSARRTFDRGLVVAYARGSLDFATELAPYCIYHECQACGRDEFFYLTRRTKSRSDHFAFASGHKLQLSGQRMVKATPPLASLGLEPLGAKRIRAGQGWRATWADLAGRPRRIAARLLDTVIAGALAMATALVMAVVGVATRWCVLVGLLIALAYEPVTAWFGGTIGKRLSRMEAISVWDCRPLGRRDALQRAFFVDLQLLVPPVAIRNTAWVLWDPARQALHDRQAASIVVTGRANKPYKR